MENLGYGSGDQRWWYCLRHKGPEKGPGCPNKDRMGPYPNEEAAQAAMATVAERNQAWDEEDAEERDGEDPSTGRTLF